MCAGACGVLALAVMGLGAQSRPVAAVQTDGPVLYENARLVPGDGSAALERAALLADKGLITRVGAAGGIAVPASVKRVDLTVDEPGVYRGQCAELCGRDHGFMPVVVEVKPQAEYDAWIEAQKAARQAAAAPAAQTAASAPPADHVETLRVVNAE